MNCFDLGQPRRNTSALLLQDNRHGEDRSEPQSQAAPSVNLDQPVRNCGQSARASVCIAFGAGVVCWRLTAATPESPLPTD